MSSPQTWRSGSGSGSFPDLPPPSPDNFGKKKLGSSGYGAQTKGKCLGGFITKQDLDSPSRVAIKVVALVVFFPLIVTKVFFDIGLAATRSFLKQLPWLLSSLQQHVITPCWDLFRRLSGAYLHFVDQHILRPSLRACKRLATWSLYTAVPYCARLAKQVGHEAWQLTVRLFHLSVRILHTHVLPRVRWALRQARALLAGVLPACLAATRWLLRTYNTLVVQPCLQLGHWAYETMRNRVLPWVWATTCTVVPAALELLRSALARFHQSVLQPAFEALRSLYVHLRYTLLPWAWATSLAIVPNLLHWTKETAAQLWNDLVLPTAKDMRSLAVFAWVELVSPVTSLLGQLSSQAIQLLREVTGPACDFIRTRVEWALGLGKELSGVLLAHASAVYEWANAIVMQLRQSMAESSAAVLALITPILTTVRDASADVVALLTEVMVSLKEAVWGATNGEGQQSSEETERRESVAHVKEQ